MITVREFTKKWKQEDFSNYNETDVREDFIRPLLYLLGYSKNRINDVITEKSLKLTEPYQRLGRDKIRIDYVPTIRLKAFWILEAKSGDPKEMGVDDMLQAYLYATHPEIQAPYIVLCNGWNLKIYDVHNYANWQEPIFSINNENCVERFDDLRDILGAETILKYQRESLLKRIHDTFEVEIDEDQLDDFARQFERDRCDLKRIIAENAKQLWRNGFEKAIFEEAERFKKLDDDKLVNIMDMYGNSYAAENEYFDRIEKSPPEKRSKLVRRLSQVYLGRPKSTFKCRYLNILLKIYEKKLDIPISDFMLPIEDSIKQVIFDNLSYSKDNDLTNALCFLDRTCCRAAGVIVKNGAMEFGTKRAEFKSKYLPKEERFTMNISAAHEIVPYIFCVADALWYMFSVGDTTEIRKNTILIDDLIDSIVEKDGIKDYPDKEQDLFHFEEFGDNYDYLSSVTYIIIRKNLTLLQGLEIEKEIIENAVSGNISSLIPRLDKTNDLKITDDERKIFLLRLINALTFGTKLYNSVLTQE